MCPFILYFSWRNKKPRVTYSRLGVVLFLFVAAAVLMHRIGVVEVLDST